MTAVASAGMRAAFNNAALRRLLASAIAGRLADGIFLLALPLAAAAAGGSALWIGAISAAQTWWWLVAVPLSTVIDRFGAGPVLLRLRSLRILLAAAATASMTLAPQPRLIALLAVAFCWGGVEALSDTALTTLPALLLREELYDVAYSLLFTGQRVAYLVVGPAVTGVLMGGGPSVPFGVAAVLLIVSLVTQWPLLTAPAAGPAGTAGTRSAQPFNDMLDGLRHLRRDRMLAAIVVTLVGIVIAEEVVATLIIPYARDGHLPGWETTLGYARAAAGAASILTALAAVAVGRRIGRLRVLALAALGGVLSPALLAVSPQVAIVVVALLVSAVAESLWVPLVQAEVMRRTPRHLMARTRGSFMFITWGSLPVASITAGVLTGVVGYRLTLVLAAAFAFVSSAAGVWRAVLLNRVPAGPQADGGDR
jgi:MFS family permease